MTKQKKPNRQALTKIFERTPVAAFGGKKGTDLTSFMASIFGPGATVEPIIHCAEVGTWVSGWTVLVQLPNGKGAHVFVLRDDDGADWEWDRLSRGRRINVLTHSLGSTRAGLDLIDLGLRLTTKISSQDDYDYDLTTSGALNDSTLPWMLRHVLRHLSTEEESALTLMAGLGVPNLDWVRGIVAAADHIAINADDDDADDDAMAAAVEAVRRYNGVTLNGAQLERIRVPGALLAYPRADWDEEADRLVRIAYDRMDLPAAFHPRPPTPPRNDSPTRPDGSGKPKSLRYPLALAA